MTPCSSLIGAEPVAVRVPAALPPGAADGGQRPGGVRQEVQEVEQRHRPHQLFQL